MNVCDEEGSKSAILSKATQRSPWLLFPVHVDLAPEPNKLMNICTDIYKYLNDSFL